MEKEKFESPKPEILIPNPEKLQEKIEKFKKDGDDDTVDQWFVVFKTETGKKVKMNVGKGFYDQVTVGEKYEKKKGVYVPVKIQINV